MLSFNDQIALQPILDSIYKVIANSKNRGAGKVIWLSVDFRNLLTSSGINFRFARPLALEIVESVLAQTCGGSVLVSAFNFDFPKTKMFNVEGDPVQSGAFGQQLLVQLPQNRTSHPFYSFMVFGEVKDELINLQLDDSRSSKSMGKGSIFEWLISNKTELITVGHHYVKSLSVIHHAEYLANVSFRYNKKFQGIINRNNIERQIICEFYVRNLSTCDFSSLTLRGDKAFRKQGLVEVQPVTNIRNPLLIQSINHAPANQLMLEDLIQGQNAYTDYFGPTKTNFDVITGYHADKLYKVELEKLL
jgi:aminoglycoside N3'-acetyltransferase